jgi:hypothetical protein
MSTGSLFNTNRKSREDFITYSNMIFDKLNKSNLIYQTTSYYDDKLTFGDLDIIFKSDTAITLNDIKQYLELDLNFNLDFNANHNIISVKYQDFQIDFIRYSNLTYDFAVNYYKYKEFATILGRLLIKYELKFKTEGLYYTYQTNFNSHYSELGSFVITHDFEKMLKCVGLNYNKFKIGFKNQSELLDYILDSDIFNNEFFYYNSKIKHNGSEKLYDICRTLNSNKLNISKEELFNRINEYINVDIVSKINEFILLEEKIKTNKFKFNHNDILENVDITKYQLNDFFPKFKQYCLSVSGNLNYIDYIYITEKSDIINTLKDFYEIYKNNS